MNTARPCDALINVGTTGAAGESYSTGSAPSRASSAALRAMPQR